MMNSTKFLQFTIRYPNRKEYLSIKDEILNEGVYDLERSRPPSKILDIGAYIGLSTLYFSQRYPEAEIIAYEPNPIAFRYLDENCSNIENINLNNLGVAKESGEREFYITESDDWYSNSSLIKKSWTGLVQGKIEMIKVVSLNDLLTRSGRLDILKLDIEGYENVLINDDLELNSVSSLMIEIHPVKKYDQRKIIKYLKKKGFNISVIQDGREIEKYDLNELFVIHATRSEGK